MRDFFFGHTRVWTRDLWISSACILTLCHVYFWFSPLTISGIIKSDAEGLVVVLFLIGPVRDFLIGHTRVWTGDLWISSPALYHCTMVTSGFHLWQFQVFNSVAEGLVVVLFWLDLWEIFFLATPGFEHRNSGSLVLHSTTLPQWLLGFTSDNFRYLTLVQRDWWWYCSWLDLWEIFSLATPGFELGTYGSLVLHSTTKPGQLLFFTSDNFRYLILMQRDWWWYCSDWTCERFSFWPYQGLNWGPLDL